MKSSYSLSIVYTGSKYIHVIYSGGRRGRDWIYSYLCKQCLSPQMMWVQIPRMRGVLDTTICDKVYQLTAAI